MNRGSWLSQDWLKKWFTDRNTQTSLDHLNSNFRRSSFSLPRDAAFRGRIDCDGDDLDEIWANSLLRFEEFHRIDDLKALRTWFREMGVRRESIRGLCSWWSIRRSLLALCSRRCMCFRLFIRLLALFLIPAPPGFRLLLLTWPVRFLFLSLSLLLSVVEMNGWMIVGI